MLEESWTSKGIPWPYGGPHEADSCGLVVTPAPLFRRVTGLGLGTSWLCTLGNSKGYFYLAEQKISFTPPP